MGGGCDQRSSGMPRFDPALYAHLPSWQKPLPDGESWEPPSSAVPLAYGSTQSISDCRMQRPDLRQRQGPMTSLLMHGQQQGMGPPLKLQLSSGGQATVSRTLLVNPSGLSQGEPSIGCEGRRSITVRVQQPAFPVNYGGVGGPLPRVPGGGRGTAATTGGQAESREANVVEHIIAHVSTMRATSDGDGGGEGGVDDDMCEDVDEVEEEEEEEEEMEDEVLPPSSGHKKTPAKKATLKGRGKGKAGSGGRTIWNLDDSLTLVRCKRDQDEALAAAGHNFARMKNKEWKWTDVANHMGALGVKRDWDQCMKWWENIFSWYKKVQLREESGKQSFFTLTPKQRNEEGYKFQMDRRLFEAIDVGQHGNQTIHPPNLVDTGLSQLQGGRNGGGGETSASENGETGGGGGIRKQIIRSGCRRTCLQLAVHLGFAHRLLRDVVIFVTKIGSAVPNRWTGGVDVTGDMVRMLVSVLAKEFEERLHCPSTFRVVVDAPLEPRDDLHGNVRILRGDVF
ncbi:hypothetical protein CBR_g26089 [Chara braunii]|uniref:Myb-like domain-containing protein n=1 Tax=Chara braunii TaxID=69332 RepID=A0A388JVV1_CHABU|nr:hypothetical protein CBR_g26089 [Chara braunii]|eukprot:GBG61926.1 hypothetical protein CBR_g26089 [Chara braunii]